MYSQDDVNKVVASMGLPFEPVPLQLADSLTAANEGRFAFLYEVGGGKTLVSTIVAVMWDSEHNVIICPPILLLQWRDWLHSIGETSVEVYANYVTDKKFRRHAEQLQAKWVIMSHNIFRDDYRTIEATYRKKATNIIVDEAQALKNPQSMLYRRVTGFVLPDKPLLLCTATPTSKPQDTYAYMKLKTPKLYRSMSHWESLHVDERDPIFKTILSYKNLDLLADNFAVASVTRTKKDLFGNTMTPIHQPMPYSLSPAHQRLYERLVDERFLELPDGDKIDATQAQRLRHMLQQIVVNYGAFSGDPEDRSAALDLLDEVLSQVNPMTGPSKLAIWTYYRSSSALVTAYLREKFGGRAVAAAYGDVDSHKAVRDIMNDDDCRILVAQPQSAGAGLNLHHVCHEMLFMEIATTPMLVKQAIGRVDRAGQKVRPTIRYGQAVGTVQVSLYNQLYKNDDLVARVERSAKTLRDEILGRV